MNPNKDSTPSGETMDEAINAFYEAVFNHAYKLGQEFPDDKDPKMVFDPCNAEDEIKLKHSLRQAIEGMAERISQVRVINHAACSINGKNHGKSCRTQSRLQEAWQAQAKEEINMLFGKE